VAIRANRPRVLVLVAARLGETVVGRRTRTSGPSESIEGCARPEGAALVPPFIFTCALCGLRCCFLQTIMWLSMLQAKNLSGKGGAFLTSRRQHIQGNPTKTWRLLLVCAYVCALALCSREQLSYN